MSAAGAAVAAQIINAVRSIGVVVKVEPQEFLKVAAKQSAPMIVRAPGGMLKKKHDYLVSYKGLAFYTRSADELRLPPDAEIVHASSMYIPG